MRQKFIIHQQNYRRNKSPKVDVRRYSKNKISELIPEELAPETEKS